MPEPAPSPFLAIPSVEWVCANDLAFAIFDRFPVSVGHVLVITKRVVPTFFECTVDEQAALMALVAEVKRLLDARLEQKTYGYNIGFNCGDIASQTVPYEHVQMTLRHFGDTHDPRDGMPNDAMVIGECAAACPCDVVATPNTPETAHNRYSWLRAWGPLA